MKLDKIEKKMIELNIYTLVLILFITLILFLVHLRLQKPLEYRRLSSHMPSATKSLWSELTFSLTIAMKHPKEILPFVMDLLKNFGAIFHTNIAGRSYVTLNDPDDIKVLLSSSQHINKGVEYEMLRPWLNDGVLLSSGSKWHNRRKLLTKAFHFKTLDMYNVSINKHSRVLTKKLLEASANDKEVSITEYITLCSLDMICDTIMGTEMNAQEGESRQYVHSLESACKIVMERVFKFWLWNDHVFNMTKSGRTFNQAVGVLHEFTNNVIRTKKALKNSENQNQLSDNKYEKKQAKSFLDILINQLDENPDQMTDKDIQEEVDTFLFGGHDTSAVVITMALVSLGIYEEIQAKTRDELYSIFGDSDRDATMEDLHAMKYLEAVIKETLRLYPSVPVVNRKLQATLNLKNYSIPPMTTVVISPYILHRNEEMYPNAEEFIPERFLDESNKSKFLFGYLPFSAGARNCMGQKYAMIQMKTLISTVIRKLKIETVGTMDDVTISPQITLKVESLPKMKFSPI